MASDRQRKGTDTKSAPAARKPKSKVAPKLAYLAPRRLPNQARAHETRDAILRAAGEEIDREGLSRLTTKRIATAAGISVGALYEYFPNKEAIVYAMVTDWLNRGFEVIDGLHPRHGAGYDILTYLNKQIDEMARIYADQPGLSTLITMITSMPDLLEAVGEHDERIAASVASALRHYAPYVDMPAAHTMARTVSLIAHELLSEAVVRRARDGEQLLHNLRVCVIALVGRLLLPQPVSR